LNLLCVGNLGPPRLKAVALWVSAPQVSPNCRNIDISKNTTRAELVGAFGGKHYTTVISAVAALHGFLVAARDDRFDELRATLPH
jgi:hypothetical protein